MRKLTRFQRVAIALLPIGPAVYLALRRLHPLGAGDWQDFVYGLPLGVCIGAAVMVMWKRRAC